MRNFAEAVRYYSHVSAELGVRFYCEMERLFREVCADPERFRNFDPPARRHFSRDFPYAVIYLEKPDSVWIVFLNSDVRQGGGGRSAVPMFFTRRKPDDIAGMNFFIGPP